MTIVELETIVEKYVNCGRLFCGRRSEYNFEKHVSDITLLVPPRSWPLNWREGCSYDVEVEIWMGKVRNTKERTLTSFRDDLNTLAKEFIEALSGDEYISIPDTDIEANYWSSDEGQTVNSQEFISFPLTLRLWAT